MLLFLLLSKISAPFVVITINGYFWIFRVIDITAQLITHDAVELG